MTGRVTTADAPPAPPTRAFLVGGFRAAGKSSVIAALVRQRPPEATWAVLAQGVAGGPAARVIADEVKFAFRAPGCPCCAGQLTFRVALTRLLRDLAPRPATLWLEGGPEGHVAETRATLLRDFAGVLELRGTIAVVDLSAFGAAGPAARERLATLCAHADRIVANRDDGADDHARRAFDEFARHCAPGVPVRRARHGAVALDWIDGAGHAA